MARSPAARASAARDMLNYTDVFRPGARAEIRAGIPPESLKAIDETIGVAWLVVAHDHWLMDRTVAVLGRDGAIDCWRRAMAMMVQRPLLRPLVEGSIRLFSDPWQHVQATAKGWPVAYRDFCTATAERLGPTEARVVFSDVAPVAFTSEGYLHCWNAVCLGLVDVVERVSPRGRRVGFELDRARARAVATYAWS